MTTVSTKLASRHGVARFTHLGFALAATACLLLLLAAISAPARAQVNRRYSETQLAELIASDGASDDQFGTAVALSADGNTALVGAIAHSGAGSAYIFTLSAGTWSQTGELIPSDGAAGDQFGFSVALSSDGTTALVGARAHTVSANVGQGAAYVFTLSGETWTQTLELTAADGVAGDMFGGSVALSGTGTTALVGAYLHAIAGNVAQGSAYAFTLSAGSWSQTQELTASDGAASAHFGYSVALSDDGSTAAVGAPSTIADGTAYEFTVSAGSWPQAQEMTAPDGSDGDDFGCSVALTSDGSIALVGAYNHIITGYAGAGAAYQFNSSGFIGEFLDPGFLPADNFGWSVALSADATYLWGGEPYYKPSSSLNPPKGEALVWQKGNGLYGPPSEELSGSDEANYDAFGYSVALSSAGNTGLAGAPNHAVAGNLGQGAAYVFGCGSNATSTSLASSKNPSLWNQSVEFTAMVSLQAGSGCDTPWGTVTFYNGSTIIGSSAIYTPSKSATYTTSALPVGSNIITAVYAGGPSFVGSTSSPLTQVVTGNASTTTTLSCSPTKSVYGQTVTCTARVASSSGAPPNGESVTFYDGANVLATETLSGGTATLSDSTLAVGTAKVKAVYGGDSNLSGSTSAVLSLTVGKATPTIAWTPSASITYGTNLSGVLNATANVPGTFSYKSDSTAETASKILAASSYSLTATFKPTSTADYGDATATAPLTVDQAPTTTTFTSTNPTITLSASGTASTTVDFEVTSYKPTGTVLLAPSGPGTATCTPATCKGTISSATGKGSVKLAFTTAGTYTVNATYQPDANHTGSTSASPLTVTVNPH
jgi:hypothetical protein